MFPSPVAGRRWSMLPRLLRQWLLPYYSYVSVYFVSALRTSRTVAYIDPGFRLRGLFFISNNYYASMSTS
ncbi:hypothetical protein KY290_002491 [Solanum tuberosum]|uniref:Uncharacterized protein n=1 Tax=Solanum tuberosum TaxID=4113 RepID=A0ABQ7WS49_SOLTU|nr:hypothetical protein KY285_002416 [Solanum tuberosum]KAH0782893.1 hypothetical protein KY290_002491 [Solanum tuberosum]